MANILLKINRHDLAEATYREGLSHNPNLYQSYFNLIQISLNRKDYEAAIESLIILKKLQPTNVQVYYLEAAIYNETGRKEEAKLILKQIINQYPDFKAASDLLRRLN
jgi:tetratricopeptide (TPR) repeat protein